MELEIYASHIKLGVDISLQQQVKKVTKSVTPVTSASKSDGARERRSEARVNFWRHGTPKKEGERKKKENKGKKEGILLGGS